VRVPVLIRDETFGLSDAAAPEDCSVENPSGLLYYWDQDAAPDWRREAAALRLPLGLCAGAAPEFGLLSPAFSETPVYTTYPVFQVGLECAPSEGEGEGEGETETVLTLTRTPAGGGGYTPGGTVDLTIEFAVTGSKAITGLGLEETLPGGWTFDSVLGGSSPPQLAPVAGTGGTLSFAWIAVPALEQFPINFTYRVNVPAEAGVAQIISGEGIYYTDGPELHTEVIVTTLNPPGKHGTVAGEANPCYTAGLEVSAEAVLPNRPLEVSAWIGNDADSDSLTAVQV